MWREEGSWRFEVGFRAATSPGKTKMARYGETLELHELLRRLDKLSLKFPEDKEQAVKTNLNDFGV
jgi:hypothetical protein